MANTCIVLACTLSYLVRVLGLVRSPLAAYDYRRPTGALDSHILVVRRNSRLFFFIRRRLRRGLRGRFSCRLLQFLLLLPGRRNLRGEAKVVCWRDEREDGKAARIQRASTKAPCPRALPYRLATRGPRPMCAGRRPWRPGTGCNWS